MDNGRIMKELKELQEGVKNVSAYLDKNSFYKTLTKILNIILIQAKGEQVVEARVMGDDLRHWKGKIFGPVSKNFKMNRESNKRNIIIPCITNLGQKSAQSLT